MVANLEAFSNTLSTSVLFPPVCEVNDSKNKNGSPKHSRYGDTGVSWLVRIVESHVLTADSASL